MLFLLGKGQGLQEQAQNYYYVSQAEARKLYQGGNLRELKKEVIVKKHLPLRNDENIISNISVTDIIFDGYLGLSTKIQ